MEYVQQNAVPTGCIMPFAGINYPAGWLLCDGSEVSRETYANLFEVIGIMYGVGNGIDTFNLPDLIDRFVEGTNGNPEYVSPGLPNIKGNIYHVQSERDYWNNSPNGCFRTSNYLGLSDSGFGNDRAMHIYFDASWSNSIYGASNTVQPKALKVKYIIKF